MESIPATLNTSEKARKYHFLPRKSMFGFLKNSTLLKTPFQVSKPQCSASQRFKYDAVIVFETLKPPKL
jgi:hypothetical protein